MPKLPCGIIILFLEEATLGKPHGKGRKTETAPNSCSDSAADGLHALGRVLPSKPRFSHLLKNQLDSMIAIAPFSLNTLGFRVSGRCPGEIG